MIKQNKKRMITLCLFLNLIALSIYCNSNKETYSKEEKIKAQKSFYLILKNKEFLKEEIAALIKEKETSKEKNNIEQKIQYKKKELLRIDNELKSLEEIFYKTPTDKIYFLRNKILEKIKSNMLITGGISVSILVSILFFLYLKNQNEKSLILDSDIE